MTQSPYLPRILFSNVNAFIDATASVSSSLFTILNEDCVDLTFAVQYKVNLIFCCISYFHKVCYGVNKNDTIDIYDIPVNQ